MTSTTAKHPWIFVRHHPVVPAAVLLLVGMAMGRSSACPAIVSASAAVVCFVVWALAEAMLAEDGRAWVAQVSLGLAMVFTGATLWQVNQSQVQNSHIGRFAPEDGEMPVTLRGRVIAPPAPGAGRHGNAFFTMEVTSLLTEQGWVDTCGLSQVKWRAGATAPELRRGDSIEAYGWLGRPVGALNPGGVDLQRRLAADRIFAQVRVPRSAGIVVADGTAESSGNWLAGVRTYLPAKLLQHTVNVDSGCGEHDGSAPARAARCVKSTTCLARLPMRA